MTNAADVYSSPENRVIGRILTRHAQERPERTFLAFDDSRLSYREANELVNRYAAGLAEAGVQRGDVIAIYLTPCPDYLLITLAVNKLGAIWSGVNPDYRGDWLRLDLQASTAKVIVTETKLLPRVLEVVADTSLQHVVLSDGPAEVPPGTKLTLHTTGAWRSLPADEPDQSGLSYSDTNAILWTSGTTGRPKGVMQSHNVWVRAGLSTDAAIGGLQPDDVLFTCLPLYNSAAWASIIYPGLVHGLTVAIDRHFSVDHFWDRCRHYGATYTGVLGAMSMFLWNKPRRPDDADHLVRDMMAVPMPEAIAKPFMERFGLKSITQGYGQSEIMPLLRRTEGSGIVYKPNCPGKPLADVEIKLLDDNDKEVPPGVPGEFCVRPLEPFTIFSGYFNDVDATLSAFRNLWYHTGDLGIRDAEGDYFFYDRKADYVRYKGRSLSSFQVEGVVNKHPAIAESAAYGLPSEELEHEAELMVAVVLKPDVELTAEELAQFINDNAPYWVVPRYIEFVVELPKTPTTRVQKYKLRERGKTERTWDREAAGFQLQR